MTFIIRGILDTVNTVMDLQLYQKENASLTKHQETWFTGGIFTFFQKTVLLQLLASDRLIYCLNRDPFKSERGCYNKA